MKHKSHKVAKALAIAKDHRRQQKQQSQENDQKQQTKRYKRKQQYSKLQIQNHGYHHQQQHHHQYKHHQHQQQKHHRQVDLHSQPQHPEPMREKSSGRHTERSRNNSPFSTGNQTKASLHRKISTLETDKHTDIQQDTDKLESQAPGVNKLPTRRAKVTTNPILAPNSTKSTPSSDFSNEKLIQSVLLRKPSKHLRREEIYLTDRSGAPLRGGNNRFVGTVVKILTKEEINQLKGRNESHKQRNLSAALITAPENQASTTQSSVSYFSSKENVIGSLVSQLPPTNPRVTSSGKPTGESETLPVAKPSVERDTVDTSTLDGNTNNRKRLPASLRRKLREKRRKEVLAKLGKAHPHYKKYTLDKHGRRCVDRHPRCEEWTKDCERSRMVKLACPLSCGKCKRDSKKSVELAEIRDASSRGQRKPSANTLGLSSGTDQGVCEDDPKHVRNCRYWRRHGACEHNSLVRFVFCRKSCGQCERYL